MAEVRFVQATRIYPGTEAPAVDALDLHIEDGEFMVLVGPSGSGKTTALRMLAGSRRSTRGRSSSASETSRTCREERDVAMVFQNYALYPYLTVEANIAFPLKIARVRKAERLAGYGRWRPCLDSKASCSASPGSFRAVSGSASRWACDRAQASVFLMDEPLSNLDAKLGFRCARHRCLAADFGITTVYVTHDQAEAMTLGHRVAVLATAGCSQCGPPRTLYERPTNVFVAGFIGSPAMNLCTVELAPNGSAALGGVEVPVPSGARANGRVSLVVGVRPESLEVASDGIPAKVDVVEDVGADPFVFCSAELGGRTTKLVARTEVRHAPRQASA